MKNKTFSTPEFVYNKFDEEFLANEKALFVLYHKFEKHFLKRTKTNFPKTSSTDLCIYRSDDPNIFIANMNEISGEVEIITFENQDMTILQFLHRVDNKCYEDGGIPTRGYKIGF